MFLSASSEMLRFNNNLAKISGINRAYKPSSQMLLVVLLKHILLRDESEQGHHFVQNLFGFFFATLKVLSQLLIYEKGDVFRRTLVDVNEELKGLNRSEEASKERIRCSVFVGIPYRYRRH